MQTGRLHSLHVPWQVHNRESTDQEKTRNSDRLSPVSHLLGEILSSVIYKVSTNIITQETRHYLLPQSKEIIRPLAVHLQAADSSALVECLQTFFASLWNVCRRLSLLWTCDPVLWSDAKVSQGRKCSCVFWCPPGPFMAPPNYPGFIFKSTETI